MYKMAGSDAQFNPDLTGLPLGYEMDHSRDNWKPLPHDQFHDGPVGGDDGVRRLLEMVVAAGCAVVELCRLSKLCDAILCLVLVLLLCCRACTGCRRKRVEEQFAKRAARLWSLQPVVKPAVPAGVTQSTNPIDAFIAADYKAKGLTPAGKADKLTLLRRVYFDLIGIPPTIARAGSVPRRPIPRRLREGGGPAARRRAARRALVAALAGCAALRRSGRPRRSVMPAARHLSVARLGDSGAESRHAVRPVRARADPGQSLSRRRR